MQSTCILNAEDDNSYYDAFARIKDRISSLHFFFETFFADHDVREAKWNHQGINWESHVLQLQH